MKNILARGVAFLLVIVFVSSPVWATCGGGGGGGGGGMSGGGTGSGGSNPVVYHVPWKVPDPKAAPVTNGLVLYWFPASLDEVKKSPLLESRDLSLYAGQCVTMQMADVTVPNSQTLIGGAKLPVAVLTTADGKSIGKVESKDGKLNLADVAKLIGGELKTRKSNMDTSLKDARARADADVKELDDKIAAVKGEQGVANRKLEPLRKARNEHDMVTLRPYHDALAEKTAALNAESEKGKSYRAVGILKNF